MSNLDRAKNVRTLEWEDLDSSTLGQAGEIVRRVPFWQGKVMVVLAFFLTFAMLSGAAYHRVRAERYSEASYRVNLFSKDLQGLIEMEAEARMKAILAGRVQFGLIEEQVRDADARASRELSEGWTDIRRGALVLSVDVNQIKALLKKVDSYHTDFVANYDEAKAADAWWQIGALLSGIVVLATALSASSKRATTLLVQSVVSKTDRNAALDIAQKPRGSREALDLPLAYCRTKEDGSVWEWGGKMRDLFGVDADTAVDKKLADLVGWREQGEIAMGTLNRLNSGEPIHGLTWDFQHPSGMTVKIKADLAPARDRTGKVVGSVCVFSDESMWHRQGARLVDAEMVKKAIVDALEDSIFRFGPRGELIEAVDKAGLLPGAESEFFGTTWQNVFPQDLNTRIAQSFKHCRINRSADQFRYEWESGEGVRHLDFRIANCGASDILAVVRDSTAEHCLRTELAGHVEQARQANELLLQSSRTDSLTGLLNHQALTEFLRVSLAYAKGSGEPISVVCLDIDGFSRFNQQLGYAAGDAVLKQVGRVLQGSLGANDRAFRIDGEDFYLILPQVRVETALARADQVKRAIEADEIEGQYLTLTTAAIELDPGMETVAEVLSALAGRLRQARGVSRPMSA